MRRRMICRIVVVSGVVRSASTSCGCGSTRVAARVANPLTLCHSVTSSSLTSRPPANSCVIYYNSWCSLNCGESARRPRASRALHHQGDVVDGWRAPRARRCSFDAAVDQSRRGARAGVPVRRSSSTVFALWAWRAQMTVWRPLDFRAQKSRSHCSLPIHGVPWQIDLTES